MQRFDYVLDRRKVLSGAAGGFAAAIAGCSSESNSSNTDNSEPPETTPETEENTKQEQQKEKVDPIDLDQLVYNFAKDIPEGEVKDNKISSVKPDRTWEKYEKIPIHYWEGPVINQIADAGYAMRKSPASAEQFIANERANLHIAQLPFGDEETAAKNLENSGYSLHDEVNDIQMFISDGKRVAHGIGHGMHFYSIGKGSQMSGEENLSPLEPCIVNYGEHTGISAGMKEAREQLEIKDAFSITDLYSALAYTDLVDDSSQPYVSASTVDYDAEERTTIWWWPEEHSVAEKVYQKLENEEFGRRAFSGKLIGNNMIQTKGESEMNYVLDGTWEIVGRPNTG